MPDWLAALDKKVTTSELREHYIHVPGVMREAMGQAGSGLLICRKKTWRKSLKKLEKIDWAKANKRSEGCAMVHGRISKARTHVLLAGTPIKKYLNVPYMMQHPGK